MPRASRSPTTPADARRGPYMPRPPASEEDRLPVHPRKNKVPADKRKRVAMAYVVSLSSPSNFNNFFFFFFRQNANLFSDP